MAWHRIGEKAIIWINVDTIYWCIFVTLGGDDLMSAIFSLVVLKAVNPLLEQREIVRSIFHHVHISILEIDTIEQTKIMFGQENRKPWSQLQNQTGKKL